MTVKQSAQQRPLALLLNECRRCWPATCYVWRFRAEKSQMKACDWIQGGGSLYPAAPRPSCSEMAALARTLVHRPATFMPPAR